MSSLTLRLPGDTLSRTVERSREGTEARIAQRARGERG